MNDVIICGGKPHRAVRSEVDVVVHQLLSSLPQALMNIPSDVKKRKCGALRTSTTTVPFPSVATDGVSPSHVPVGGSFVQFGIDVVLIEQTGLRVATRDEAAQDGKRKPHVG